MDGALKSFTEDLDLVAPAVWHALPEVHTLSLLFTSARRLPALQCDGQVRLLTVVQQHLCGMLGLVCTCTRLIGVLHT